MLGESFVQHSVGTVCLYDYMSWVYFMKYLDDTYIFLNFFNFNSINFFVLLR